MAKSIIKNILTSLTKAAQTTGVQHIYLPNRPMKADESIKNFVVIDLPLRIHREVKGNDDFLVTTSGTYTIGVRSKSDNTMNLNATTDLLQQFLELFPINDEYITATNPEIILRGGDDTNFQKVSIMFDIRTKINSYLK